MYDSAFRRLSVPAMAHHCVALAALYSLASPALAQAVPAPSTPAPVGAVAEPVPVRDKFLPLEVIVNGAFGGTWVLIERRGVIYAPKEAFLEWRVGLRQGVEGFDHQGTMFYPLSAVPGFSAQINTPKQTLELTFASTAFAASVRNAETFQRTPVSPVLPSVYLNYDVNYTQNHVKNGANSEQAGVLTEAGVSLGKGVLTSTAVGRNLVSSGASTGPREWVRLDSTYTLDVLGSNQTLRFGDSTTRAGSLGRSVYFGGVQVGTNFGLSPGFIGQPKPTVSGVSSAPSTVELYVNDVLRQTSQVPTGPFTLDNLPQINGGAQTRVVVRDLLGRETVVQQSVFSNASMLAAGLNDWSAELGALRENYALRSNTYGAPFVSGLWRRGLTNGFTGESRIELTEEIKTVGLGALVALPLDLLGRFALIGSRVTSAGSAGSVITGQQGLLGLEYAGNRWSSGVQVQAATAQFRQLGLDLATKPDKLQTFANVNYAMPDGAASMGVSMASVSRYDNPRITTLSGNVSHRAGPRGRLNWTLNRSTSGNTGANTSLGVSLSIPLDNDVQLGAGLIAQKNGNEFYASAQYNPLDDGYWGWRIAGGQREAEESGYAEANVYYPGQYGRFSADLSARENQTNTRLGLTGAVSVVGGGLHISQKLNNSFALVDVPGYPGVPILVGGQRRGSTDMYGRLLVPRLAPYQTNSIQLDANALPISAELDSIESPVVPAWRSAALAKFTVRSGRAAVINIKLDDGTDAPAGAVLRMDNDNQDFYVANRGLAYVTGLSEKTNLLTLTWKDQKCRLEVLLPAATKDDIAKVGPVVCKGVRK
jgi:outer membrane usher protein